MGDTFVPGLRLAGEFYAEAVRPLLEAEFPGLGYAAALIGPGSEVLGFDTERSADHDWGPRLLVFLEDDDADRLAGAVDEMLGQRLPAAFGGYPVAFGVTRDPGSGARHRVEIFGLSGWLSLAARVRPARRRHGAGLAGRPVAAAGGGHRGRRLP